LAVAIAANAVRQTAAAEGENHDYGGHRRPVYQRRAFEWKDSRRHHGDFRGRHFVPPQVNASWFQRPYPYHLDYYKMRYGGSYAPYFGNLYGPPQVVTAPPYYGPYYGGGESGFGGFSFPTGYEEIPPQVPSTSGNPPE
jgi:hypothetical protein